MEQEIQVARDKAQLCRIAAQYFLQIAEPAVRDHGRLTVALSGGNTPRALYELLAAEYANKIPWDKVHIFFGDERQVPSDHPDSNHRMANEALLSRVAIPAQNVHRVRTELGPESAALDYENQLRAIFQPSTNEWPRFELVLLGLGDDGHTASLFPGTAALEESSRWFVANWVEKLQTFRLTLTFPVLNNAVSVLFLVSGSGKSEILKQVLVGPAAQKFPAQCIQPLEGKLLWLIGQDAAAALLHEKTHPPLKLL